MITVTSTIGRLGGDPELKTSAKNNDYLLFELAVEQGYPGILRRRRAVPCHGGSSRLDVCKGVDALPSPQGTGRSSAEAKARSQAGDQNTA